MFSFHKCPVRTFRLSFPGSAGQTFYTMKEYAKRFYKSKAWQKCRVAYAKSVGGLCEICLANGVYTPGEIVHHKNHISPETIDDPTVTLDWRNLELVCRECHRKLHEDDINPNGNAKRYSVDSFGRVTIAPASQN